MYRIIEMDKFSNGVKHDMIFSHQLHIYILYWCNVYKYVIFKDSRKQITRITYT